MSECDYAEVIIHPNVLKTLDLEEIGSIVAHQLERCSTVVFRRCTDLNPKPFATDNENNYNRLEVKG